MVSVEKNSNQAQSEVNKDELLNKKWISSDREVWVGTLKEFLNRNSYIAEDQRFKEVTKDTDFSNIEKTLELNKAFEIYFTIEKIQSSKASSTKYYSEAVVDQAISDANGKSLEAKKAIAENVYHKHLTQIYSNIDIGENPSDAEIKVKELHSLATLDPLKFEYYAQSITNEEWEYLYLKLRGKLLEKAGEESNVQEQDLMPAPGLQKGTEKEENK
ncbi:MAG: hypothetical protein ACP5RP_02055, partial [Candidatus Micrarchaeia archaeon]